MPKHTYQPYYPRGYKAPPKPTTVSDDRWIDELVEPLNRRRRGGVPRRIFLYTQQQLDYIDRAEELFKLTKAQLVQRLIDCQDSLEALQ